jgi:hypothetical protein
LAIVWKHRRLGCANLALRTHVELDLTHQSDVGAFFTVESLGS